MDSNDKELFNLLDFLLRDFPPERTPAVARLFVGRTEKQRATTLCSVLLLRLCWLATCCTAQSAQSPLWIMPLWQKETVMC